MLGEFFCWGFFLIISNCLRVLSCPSSDGARAGVSRSHRGERTPPGALAVIKLGSVGQLRLFRHQLPLQRASGTPGKGYGSLCMGPLCSCPCCPAGSVGCTTATGHRWQALGKPGCYFPTNFIDLAGPMEDFPGKPPVLRLDLRGRPLERCLGD